MLDEADFICYDLHMMTRKHFEAIAHTLNANRVPDSLVLDFADMLEEQNDRFDRGLFVKAASANRLADLRQEVGMLERAIRGNA